MLLEKGLNILLLGDPRRELDLRLTVISIGAAGIVGKEVPELLGVAVGPRHLVCLVRRSAAPSWVLVA